MRDVFVAVNVEDNSLFVCPCDAYLHGESIFRCRLDFYGDSEGGVFV